jgi:predicted amidohydrolase YtcJ
MSDLIQVVLDEEKGARGGDGGLASGLGTAVRSRWSSRRLVSVVPSDYNLTRRQGRSMTADRIFINGNLLTIRGGPAQALAVRDGRIAAVGQTAEIQRLTGPQTDIVDLKRKTLMPAFIDAHMHLVSQGLKETGYILDLSKTRSLNEALEGVRETVRHRGQGAWIRGRGWDESTWPERRYITRADLDPIAPKNPVALSRIDGHMLVANTQALRLVTVKADADEFDPEQGLLRERAVDGFLRQIAPRLEDMEAAIRAATRLAHSLGITAVHDVVQTEHMRAYQHLHRRAELRLRIRMNPLVERLNSLMELGFSSNFGDQFLQLGAIKIFTDGSIGARNAALFEPYADAPNPSSGKLNYEQEELNALVKQAHAHKFQLMIHAIGDRAIQAALDALQAAGVGPEDRARIEHLELPTEQQLELAQELGVIASMQPNFLQWSGPKGLYETRLGSERDARIDPHRAVIEHGISLAFGSDGMPFHPLYGIHLAVNAPHEAQRLTVDEALSAYTLGAAYAGFQERALGSLEPGKWADLVVLSADPTSSPEQIQEIQVLETYLGGERIFAADT